MKQYKQKTKVDESLIEEDQTQGTDKKSKAEIRKQLDDLLAKKPLGTEDTEDDYLDHYYDFDDLDKKN